MWTCRSLCEAGASAPYSKFGVFSNRKKCHNNGNNTFSHIFIRRILQLSWILLIFALCSFGNTHNVAFMGYQD
jgi:hypothetical protein